jgi:hypothetical protein
MDGSASGTILHRMAGKTCVKCGNPLPEHARFCGQCGTLTEPSGPAVGPAAPSPRVIPGARPPAENLGRTLIEEVPAGSVANPSTQPDTLIDAIAPTPMVSVGGPAPAPTPAGSALGKTMIDAPRPAPPEPAPRQPVQRTMLGFATPGGPPAAVPPAHAPPAAPTPAPSAPAISGKGTMLGMPASNVWGAPPPAQPAPTPAAGPVGPGKPGAPLRTMLGVAIPGIAPLNPGQDAPPPSAASYAQKSGTMLGVAMPGIAPIHPGDLPPPPAPMPEGQLRKAVEIVPAPPPLVDEPLPPPPVIVPKRGVPLVLVAGLIAFLVLGAGVVVALVWKSKPLLAEARADPSGKEALHLRCDTCPDGTLATLDGAQSTFHAHETDVPLKNPLKVGDNALVVHLDRPSIGRDEAVKLDVPIKYRVRADLSDIGAAHPVITVRVEALPGSDASVDGKPVALDASGTGAYAIDISADTEGPADDKKTIDRTIPYVVTPKAGTPDKGTVRAQVDVAPLYLDAPGLHPVIDTGTFHLAGRTLKGGTVSANGRPLHMDADGTFTQPFDAPAVGDLPVELTAAATSLAPRTAHIVVRRVAHLEDEAKARDKAPELGYDAIAADIAAVSGQSSIVEGEVADARTAQSQTIAVVDDTRGCAHAPCLVRVVYGGEAKIKHGQVIRAYGRVTRAVTSTNGTVPEVEADFILPGHAKK